MISFDDAVHKISVKANFYMFLNEYMFSEFRELPIKLLKDDNIFQYTVNRFSTKKITGTKHYTFGELYELRNNLIMRISQVHANENIVKEAKDLIDKFIKRHRKQINLQKNVAS